MIYSFSLPLRGYMRPRVNVVVPSRPANPAVLVRGGPSVKDPAWSSREPSTRLKDRGWCCKPNTRSNTDVSFAPEPQDQNVTVIPLLQYFSTPLRLKPPGSSGTVQCLNAGICSGPWTRRWLRKTAAGGLQQLLRDGSVSDWC